MDLDTFKRFIESLTQNVPESMDVYICDPVFDRPFPDSDISDALFNTVFVKLNW